MSPSQRAAAAAEDEQRRPAGAQVEAGQSFLAAELARGANLRPHGVAGDDHLVRRHEGARAVAGAGHAPRQGHDGADGAARFHVGQVDDDGHAAGAGGGGHRRGNVAAGHEQRRRPEAPHVAQGRAEAAGHAPGVARPCQERHADDWPGGNRL